ncbi:unnamed protein product [Protopolystoma xenopodis]|uniref:Uncharacterized protein n=1 Tax=Protopolystoma xenopodis TaxID=117903 RepID=A0A3S5BLN5_9PLAT|nr:unnamed protein product [Protopolystoma xenopodis]
MSLSPGEAALPLRKMRQACWSAKDAYTECVDSLRKAKGDEFEKIPTSEIELKHCFLERRAFLAACPQQWVNLLT